MGMTFRPHSPLLKSHNHGSVMGVDGLGFFVADFVVGTGVFVVVVVVVVVVGVVVVVVVVVVVGLLQIDLFASEIML